MSRAGRGYRRGTSAAWRPRNGTVLPHESHGLRRADNIAYALEAELTFYRIGWKQEGRSLNDLVAADAVTDRRESFRRRLERSGRRALPPAPMQRPPTLDGVLDANRGSGTAVSDALRTERDAR